MLLHRRQTHSEAFMESFCSFKILFKIRPASTILTPSLTEGEVYTKSWRRNWHLWCSTHIQLYPRALNSNSCFAVFFLKLVFKNQHTKNFITALFPRVNTLRSNSSPVLWFYIILRNHRQRTYLPIQTCICVYLTKRKNCVLGCLLINKRKLLPREWSLLSSQTAHTTSVPEHIFCMNRDLPCMPKCPLLKLT